MRVRGVLAVATLALACAGAPVADDHGGEPADAYPPAPLAIAVGGLPATAPGAVARVLAEAGARAANAPCALLRWTADASRGAARRPEVREPPWAPVDAWVRALHAAGYRDLSLCLDFEGTPPGPRLLAPRSPLPDGDEREALAAWVGRVVERYDGDGEGDLEGLLAPVRRFRIGTALGPGGVEPFDAFPALLASVHASLRAASGDALLVLPPLRARGVAPGALAWRIEHLLAGAPAFDAWSLEASGSAEELDDWLVYLGERTPELPVEIVGGATRPLAEAGAPARCDASAAERPHFDAATPEAEPCALASVFALLLARDPDALAWARAITARDLVYKAIVAASRGVVRAELGSAHDARWWTDPALEAGAGLAAWSGLLDAGSGGAYPAYFALRQLEALMRGRDTVTRVPGTAPDARIFTLDGAAGTAFVGWSAPARFVGPGEPPPMRSVTLDVGHERVWLVQLISEPGTAEAPADDRETAEGRLWLDLTPTPVFVLPDRG